MVSIGNSTCLKVIPIVGESLCDYSILCIPSHSDLFMLETDASSTGVGAVLNVKRNDSWTPVAYYSKQWCGVQKNYSAQELKGLALFLSIQHFSYYLYGRQFTVLTDHKPLVSLMTAKQDNRRLLNWS